MKLEQEATPKGRAKTPKKRIVKTQAINAKKGRSRTPNERGAKAKQKAAEKLKS